MPTDYVDDGLSYPASILVSVPKRCFKRAVDRNRIKRQLRETYRLNKHILQEKYNKETGKRLVVGFIWMSPIHLKTSDVNKRMEALLTRIAENRDKECTTSADTFPEA